MGVPVMLASDEVRLIEVVRAIKAREGFGEFQGAIANREITTIREQYTHKLNK